MSPLSRELISAKHAPQNIRRAPPRIAADCTLFLGDEKKQPSSALVRREIDHFGAQIARHAGSPTSRSAERIRVNAPDVVSASVIGGRSKVVSRVSVRPRK
jgi:hypothetical protein